jgi:hypothetical protein
MPIPPDVAAQVAIKTPAREAEMRSEARKTGFDDQAFAAFKDAADIPPGVDALLELHRRDKISTDELVAGFQSAMIEQRWHTALLDLLHTLLSPADAANARQQEFITPQRQREIAAKWGFALEDAEVMFELAGLPPGIGEGLELLRRGKIDESRFRQYVHEGHTKTKYEDDLLELKWQPLSASIAAEALVRRRMSEAEAVRIAEENGIRREDFLKWSDMIGRPIATGQALQLARRGEFTYEQFVDSIARSDVRTEFADDLWKLRRVIPPLFQVLRLIASGSISDEMAIGYITEDGYDKELAAAIVHAGHKDKTKRTHDLTAAQIDLLYEAGLETETVALQKLKDLGYDDAESREHLQLLDARLIVAAHNASIRRIHTLYTTHKIDDATMQADLDALQLDVRVKELLVHEWVQERNINVKDLTDAEIGQALRYGIISRDEAVSRWQTHGYSVDNATIKADIVQRRRRLPAA